MRTAIEINFAMWGMVVCLLLHWGPMSNYHISDNAPLYALLIILGVVGCLAILIRFIVWLI